MDCLFCAIVAGDIPARKVYEDATALAFLDINPWHRGHTLVIPKRHVENAFVEAGVWAEVANAIASTGELLQQRLGAQGMNLLSNAGAVAGQEVFHMHLHLIPRFADNPGIAALRTPEANIDLDEVFEQLGCGPQG